MHDIYLYILICLFVCLSIDFYICFQVQDVFEFIRDLPGCSDYADTFRSQEIDGQALLLLKEDHLMTAMCMKLGPALKLISQINTIKEELSLHT